MTRNCRIPEALNALEVRARAKKVRRIFLSNHAEERMIERDILMEDIYKVLDGGSVLKPEFNNGSWKYSMELYRHDLCCTHKVVFAFCGKASALVITAIRKE